MAYDINAALERLEQNLSDLDSARKQVESMVSTSKDLQSVVERYVKSIKGLYSDVKSWETQLQSSGTEFTENIHSAIGLLKSSCESTASSLQNSADQIIESFSSRSEAPIARFTEQNMLFASRVQELAAFGRTVEKANEEISLLKSVLNHIQRDLETYQSSQGQMLSELKEKSETYPEIIKKATDTTIEQYALWAKEFSQQLDTLTQTVLSIQTVSNTIQSSIGEMMNSVESSQASIKREININRWILIAGVIILVLLRFI